MDSGICQTSTASPAEPEGIPTDWGCIETVVVGSADLRHWGPRLLPQFIMRGAV